MIALHLCIALTPLAIYLSFLAAINLSRRPCVMSGFRDTTLLAMGLSGLFVVGPLELFLPEQAAFRFGPYVWLLLIALYALSAALLILSMRPRIVVYNMNANELRSVLSPIVSGLDDQARWLGDTAVLPRWGIQFHLDGSPALRNIQLVATGSEQNYLGWARLQRELREKMAQTSGRRSLPGLILLTIAALLATVIAASLVADRESMAKALEELLRM